MAKNRIANLIIVFISALFMAMLGINTANYAQATATIDYETTIYIRQNENGFSYGNDGGDSMDATDLQTIFNAIDDKLNELNSSKNPEIVFENIETDKTIEINARTWIFTGNATYTGRNDTSFITVNGGELRVSGVIQSESANIIKIEENGKLQTSGTLSVVGSVGVQQIATIRNNGGEVIINDGFVSSKNTDDFTGIAYYQSGNNGKLTMKGGEVFGQTAMVLQNGNAELSGGSIYTLKGNSSWDDVGIALKVSNAAKATLSGTVIENKSERIEETTYDGQQEPIAVSFEGNGEGKITFTGGEVKGKIILSQTSPSVSGGGYVYVNNRKIRQVKEGRIYLYTDENALTVDNGKLGFIGNTQDGYYLKSWNGDSSKGENPLLSSFGENDSITPYVSNLCNITLVRGKGNETLEMAYNSVIDFTSGDLQWAPSGYKVSHWSDGINTGTKFRITKRDMTFTASFSLDSPVIGDIRDLTCSYDEEIKTISAGVVEVDGLSYTYLWEKYDEESGQWVRFSDSGTLSVRNHSDSGKYRLTVEVSDGSQTESAKTQPEITVRIDKINYEGITHRKLEGTYDKKKTLGDYALDEGFFWKVANTVPTVNQTEYDAEYCLDTDNYNKYPLKITLELKKAAGVEANYPMMQGEYVYSPDKKLSDYVFTEDGWRWENPDAVPNAGQNGYGAFYNPDTNNYEDYLTTVYLEIKKAKYTGNRDLKIAVKYSEDLTVGDAFDNADINHYFMNGTDREQKLEQVKIYEFNGIYNADPKNYDNYNDIKIKIEVQKGDYADIFYGNENKVSGGNYSNKKTLKDIPLLKDGFYWVDEDALVGLGGEFKAYYNICPDKYNNYELTLTVVMEKGEVPQEDRKSFGPIKVTYSPGKTLEQYYELPEGFAWENKDLELTVGSHDCVVRFLETEFYYPYDIQVKIELDKAVYDLSNVKFADKTVVYNGEYHIIKIEGELPAGITVKDYKIDGVINNEGVISSGLYNVSVSFLQADEDNYEKVNDMSATLNIERGKYDMSGVKFADKTVVYNGEHHIIEIEGELPDGVKVDYKIGGAINNEGVVNSGSYGIIASFSQEDTVNYRRIDEMSATLTINKAECVFLGDKTQQTLYDGNKKKPEMRVNNDEQNVFDDANGGYIDFGRYKVKFYTKESLNYKAGEVTVDFEISGHEIEYDEETKVSVFDLDSAQSGNITVEKKVAEKTVTVTLLLDGQEQEGLFGIKIEVPAELRGQDVKVDYVTQDGTRIKCDVKEDDGYLWWSTDKLGKFVIYAQEPHEKDNMKLQWWIWLMVGLGCAIVVGGLIFVIIFFIKRKGQSPVRQIRTLLKKKTKEIVASEETTVQEIDEGGTNDEER